MKIYITFSLISITNETETNFWDVKSRFRRKKMACARSEYDDKNLKKNAFSGRRLRQELDRLDAQKGQLSKHFRHEKDKLKRELQEGGEILKLKSLDPTTIRPLSNNDTKKLSPRFARKLSGLNALPQILVPHDNSEVIQPSSRREKRRYSLPPIIVQQEYLEYEAETPEHASKLLQRRSSANNALQKDTEDMSKRINEFFQKISNATDSAADTY